MPISDRKMFEMWRQREAMKARISKLVKAVDKRDKAIIAEFERRGIRSVTDAETKERITYVQAEPLVYDWPEIERRLKRTPRGRKILDRCTVTQIDTKALAAEVQAGNISSRTIAACSEIKKNKPYLVPGGGD